MPNVSDIIEEFILSTMGNSDDINLSRNELADFFNCAPSQINYVLTTRFNLPLVALEPTRFLNSIFNNILLLLLLLL